MAGQEQANYCPCIYSHKSYSNIGTLLGWWRSSLLGWRPSLLGQSIWQVFCPTHLVTTLGRVRPPRTFPLRTFTLLVPSFREGFYCLFCAAQDLQKLEDALGLRKAKTQSGLCGYSVDRWCRKRQGYLNVFGIRVVNKWCFANLSTLFSLGCLGWTLTSFLCPDPPLVRAPEVLSPCSCFVRRDVCPAKF